MECRLSVAKFRSEEGSVFISGGKWISKKRPEFD
jgi:hypothetical protein